MKEESRWIVDGLLPHHELDLLFIHFFFSLHQACFRLLQKHRTYLFNFPEEKSDSLFLSLHFRRDCAVVM